MYVIRKGIDVKGLNKIILLDMNEWIRDHLCDGSSVIHLWFMWPTLSTWVKRLSSSCCSSKPLTEISSIKKLLCFLLIMFIFSQNL